MTPRRVPRLALYAGWTTLAVLLFVLSPGTLPVLDAGLHWLIGLSWLGMAVLTRNEPARLGRVPVRLVLIGAAAVFLVLAVLKTYQALA
jgi:hypothetical protein